MKAFDGILFIVYKIAINVIALGLVAAVFKHVEVTDFGVLVAAAIILTGLNLLIKPFLLLISLPVVFLTLGLGYFIVNAIIIMLTSWAVKGYQVDGFWTAVGAGLFVSVVNVVFDFFAQSRKDEFRG